MEHSIKRDERQEKQKLKVLARGEGSFLWLRKWWMDVRLHFWDSCKRKRKPLSLSLSIQFPLLLKATCCWLYVRVLFAKDVHFLFKSMCKRLRNLNDTPFLTGSYLEELLHRVVVVELGNSGSCCEDPSAAGCPLWSTSRIPPPPPPVLPSTVRSSSPEPSDCPSKPMKK